MKATLHLPSNSQIYSTWAVRYDPIKPTKPLNPKTSVKPLLAVSKPPNISLSFNHEYQDEEKVKPFHLNQESPENFDLPVVIRRSGTISRYFWDGKELQLVSVDGDNQFSVWSFYGMRKLGGVCGAAVRNFFLPREVSENYLEYVKWKFVHRVFSSALQVLATQVPCFNSSLLIVSVWKFLVKIDGGI